MFVPEELLVARLGNVIAFLSLMETTAIQTDISTHWKVTLKPVFFIYGLLSTSISTFVASYTIAIITDKISADRFLISDTFAHDPARAIASFGLSLTSAFAIMVFLCRYLIGCGSKRESLAMCLALFACVCMLGVHAFTITYSRIVHNLSAFGLFASGISAAAIFVSEERRQANGVFTPILKLRYALIAASVVSLIVMVSGFVAIEYALGSGAEISMAVFMFACLSTYYREFRQRRVVLLAPLSSC